MPECCCPQKQKEYEEVTKACLQKSCANIPPLVRSSCPNTIPHTEVFSKFSHSSEGGEVQNQSAGPFGTWWRLFLACRQPLSHCVLTQQRKSVCFFFFFFFKKNIYWFIYLAVLGLSCRMWTLSCDMWDLVPQPGIEPGHPALGMLRLSHGTTWEVPSFS